MPTATGLSFLAGVLFGLALAAPPGPMNAIIAEESVARGWVAGFVTGLGAMVADVVFFVLALFGLVAVVEEAPRLRGVMVTVGGVLMLYFAVGAFRSARATLVETDEVGDARGFWKALALGLTNPFQVLFWLTVGVALLDPGRLDVLEHLPYVGETLAGAVVVETGSAALLVGLFAGIVVWIVAFPAALLTAGRRVDSFAPLVAGASALVLAGFGLVFFWDGLASVL